MEKITSNIKYLRTTTLPYFTLLLIYYNIYNPLVLTSTICLVYTPR